MIGDFRDRYNFGCALFLILLAVVGVLQLFGCIK